MQYEPCSVLTSPSEHVCAVLRPGCSPYGSRDMENLSLSSFLYLCQALLFLLRPFPSLTSVTVLTMLSCSAVLSPPPLPPSLLLSSHLFSYITLSFIPFQFLIVLTTYWRRGTSNINLVSHQRLLICLQLCTLF